MKKVILTLILSFSFLFSFGNETKTIEKDVDFFNCWRKVVYLTTNPETFETTSFVWYEWLGYAGSQESCNRMAVN